MTVPTGRRARPAVAGRVAADFLRFLAGEYVADVLPPEITWSGRVEAPLRDESAVQAACGIMHVHGRAAGRPQRLGVDYAGTVAGVLAAQGVLAASIARARGARLSSVRTSVAEAALLAVRQYLAVASTDDESSELWEPGGRPPLVSRDGVVFEVETLHAEQWSRFWHQLGADRAAVAEGWWPFQQRFATASARLPDALHRAAGAVDYEESLRAASSGGISVLPVRSDSAPPVDVPPCRFHPLPGGAIRRGPETEAPLSGIVVVESTRRIQGPMVGHVLRALGADVLRVEPPGGDPMRGIPPVAGGCSARYRALNDGKQPVELDITVAGDRRALRDLVAGADVFVHNWAPGKAEALGLDAGDLVAARPGLVYAWASGWEPLSWENVPLGTDFLVQAHSGLAAAVYPEGEPRAPSLMTLVDILGGLVCAAGVLASLLRRVHTGRGSRVDSSLYSASGLIPRTGRPRFRDTDRPLSTEDGYLVLPDGADVASVAPVLGMPPDAAPDELVARLRREPTQFWTDKLADAGTPATPVCTDLRHVARDDRFDAVLSGHGPVFPRAPWEFV